MDVHAPAAVGQPGVREARPQPAAPRPRAIPRLPAALVLVGLALATGLLLWLSYFPVAWGWLGWVALAPLLCLVRRPGRARWTYLAAWLAGLAFFFPVLQWMRVADPRMYYTWAALALYCSLYFPLAIFLLRRLEGSGWPLVLTLPVVWTALEYVRGNLFTGFSWYFLGYTQQDFLPVIQVADLGGVYAVTFVVAAVNALVFEVLAGSRRLRALAGLPEAPAQSGRALLVQAAAVLLLVGGTVAYGSWRLSQEAFRPGPRVALIQGNLDQRIRNAAEGEDAKQVIETVAGHFERLSARAAGQRPAPDLIVWSETSFPEEWGELAPDYPEDRLAGPWRSLIDEMRQRPERKDAPWRDLVRLDLNPRAFAEARYAGTPVLLGLNATVVQADDSKWRYNSAVLIEPDGRVAGRYDKMHRVVFGEYVPLRDWLPWMNRLAPYDSDYSIRVGEHFTRFPLKGGTFGAIICYEDADPDLARQYVAPGPEKPVDFLVNISNDGWFDGSSEHQEHLAVCRFRAVESRRAVARAVNMGISAVIDGSGRVVALPGRTWAESKKVAAVLTAVVPVDDRESPYARWGDWLPGCCGVVLLLGLVRSVLPSRLSRKPN